MFAVCLRYSNCYADAQDTFQEAFIKCFDKIDLYKGNGSFEGWLRRLMVNMCMDKFRKNKMTIVTENPNDLINQPTEELETDTLEEFPMEELIDLIQKMPNQYRIVFNMYIVENYTHVEISEVLNISVGTSKSNLSRAKKWLRNELKKKEFTIKDSQNVYQKYI